MERMSPTCQADPSCSIRAIPAQGTAGDPPVRERLRACLSYPLGLNCGDAGVHVPNAPWPDSSLQPRPILWPSDDRRILAREMERDQWSDLAAAVRGWDSLVERRRTDPSAQGEEQGRYLLARAVVLLELGSAALEDYLRR